MSAQILSLNSGPLGPFVDNCLITARQRIQENAMGQNYREVQRIWNPSKTTDRTAIACTRCRRRRKQVKCDGASPRCQRCVWSGEEC
ncbi:hypothetical protein BC936DRAFT_150034 [Jimgerdemannia flammicorona]|uniref:Zn(2)-C6 fungal-type domain-containing protein n=1 Tax=Jimgerdemannia flammicorona TaxID=994334 RepID=A0A433CZL3_9FUNG|nr:hypothetical protein BC936DRAFT_150034 [Jimgerdemannia flammicorona]